MNQSTVAQEVQAQPGNQTATRGMKWNVEPGSEWAAGETDNMSVMSCNSCGGEIICEDTTASSTCPYCGSAVEFKTAYLAGFMADKYDIDAQTSIKAANERIKRSTEDAFRETVSGFAGVAIEESYINLQNGVARYALYPVWMLNTKWNGILSAASSVLAILADYMLF